MASARSGRLDEARALLEHLRTTSPRDPDVLQLLGMLARQLGDQPAAIALFRQSLAVEPRQPHVLNNLGNACAATGQQVMSVLALAPCEQPLVQGPRLMQASRSL